MLNKNELSIFEALVVGIFFSFLISWTQTPSALPLIDFFPNFFQSIVLPILSMATIVLIYFQKKYLKSFLLLAFLSLLIVTIYRYSTGYAFRSFVLFVLMFPIVFARSGKREMQVGSIIIISLLFIFAGLQKINSYYLSGAEFLSGSPFMSFMDLWFPGKIPQVLSNNLILLPYLSVALELGIGIGILFRPKLFSHLAAFFMLAMSFINPPILNVYFFLLPFLLLADDNISDFLEKSTIRNFLGTPFFWTFLIYILTPNFKSFEAALGRSYLFILILIAMHAYVLFFSKVEGNSSSGINLRELRTTRILIIPTFMLLFFVGSYYFLPSPFGFKMFSGKRFQLGFYDLRITNSEACNDSLKRWVFVPVTDSALIKDQGSCHILFPTLGGINYAGKYLCRKNGEQVFTIKSSTENSEKPLKCSDFYN